MTIYFSSPNPFPMEALQIMGVSAKLHENSIGRFGTGLKYAIAVLLRNGAQVSMRTGGAQYMFSVRPHEVRGKTFQVIYMNDTQLPFSLDYGQNWELWMAFRELASNTLDERGAWTHSSDPAAATEFAITHPEFETIASTPGTVFLTPTGFPVYSNEQIAIYRSNGTPYIYFNGIRVMSAPKPSRWTYNISGPAPRLTEDRTLADGIYAFRTRTEAFLADSTSAEFVERFIRDMSDEKALESEFLYSPPVRFSPLAKQIIEDLQHRIPLQARLLDNFRKAFPEKRSRKPAELLESEDETIEEALELLLVCGVPMTRERFQVVPEMEREVLGWYDSQTQEILISIEAVRRGSQFLASTLYEEWLHSMHYEDYTRAFQDRVLSLAFSLAATVKALRNKRPRR